MQRNHSYYDCMDELHLNTTGIEDCMNSNLGIFLSLLAQKDSVRVMDATEGVPAVIYDGIIDPVAASSSLSDLKNVVKKKLRNRRIYFDESEKIEDSSSGESSSLSPEVSQSS